MDEFTGFPVAALDFYDDLEMDNTRSFWEAHKQVYLDAVRAPMIALTGALAAEFGTAKVFRPYRDVRFAKDKTPYKNHQGAFVAVAPSTGWYVQIGAPGVRVGGGFYRAESTDLARIRTAIADDRSGPELEAVLEGLVADGLTVGGEQLKRPPRGYDADHPRVDLLRHKSITASRDYGFDEVIHTGDLLGLVREDWRRMRPLVEWVAARVDQLAEPTRRR
ncbi:MAG TPA: DUF2461 domain-containing protein [Marmoricola sp.]|nr:DUF2461 domain-containing protein [Marmoricola sp.]